MSKKSRIRSSPLYVYCLLFSFLFCPITFAAPVYLQKFLLYLDWCQHLPRTPDETFLAFIEKPSPLTKKLREKWLYQLAYNKDWSTFLRYYRGSSDTNLQCYAETTRYNQGLHHEAILASKSIWLNGESLPKACDALFNAILKNHEMNDDLIQQRIALALEKRNVSLARYLLKQLSPPRVADADLLNTIHQQPTKISTLTPSTIHGEFYLYGLKLMISRNMDKAIQLWEQQRKRRVMNERQEQSFLVQIALFKAMRNEPDARRWFAKIKPAYYTNDLLEWEVRYALSRHHWAEVLKLTQQSKNKNEPIYQYWAARALASTGQKEKAHALYATLAQQRHYYGFLASMKLHIKPNFQNETTITAPETLLPYKPITDQIKALYLSHQTLQASRLLNDFVSELPKKEKSALAYWVGHDLQWHGKSIYLSTNDDLNNQLSLRFPLAHHEAVQTYSRHSRISPEMIYAIIRQESSFHDDIVSPAGANGLMQLMPATARLVARRENIPYTHPKELFSPQKNIHLGSAYLSQLSKQYHQHPVLMAAAYNAGPSQVNRWLKNHLSNEMDIWIETLPWRETRNYLKNIFSFYAVYQYRLQQKPNLTAFMQPF
jgi:soluble lytic murein transglycosylase